MADADWSSADVRGLETPGPKLLILLRADAADVADADFRRFCTAWKKGVSRWLHRRAFMASSDRLQRRAAEAFCFSVSC